MIFIFFSIFLTYSRHIYIIFKAYSSIFTEILQKILNVYILTYWGIFENIQYFPPQKPNVSEYAQNTHTNTQKSLGATFHPFRKNTFIFIFTSYSPRIGMVLVIYCYNIQKIFKYWIFCSFLSHIQYKHPTGPKFENIRKFIFWHIGVIFSIFSQTRPPAEYAEYAVNIIKICPRI